MAPYENVSIPHEEFENDVHVLFQKSHTSRKLGVAEKLPNVLLRNPPVMHYNPRCQEGIPESYKNLEVTKGKTRPVNPTSQTRTNCL